MQDIINKTADSFRELAQLLDIPIKDGWITGLAKKLEMSRGSIYSWINRDKISKKGLVKIENKGYPREQWHIQPIPYPETPETIGIPKTDNQRSPGAMSYAAPDLGGTQRITVVDRPDSAYLADVEEVLKSNETGVVAALKANIVQFREIVRERKQREEDKKRIQVLENQVNQLAFERKTERNIDTALPSFMGNAENE